MGLRKCDFEKWLEIDDKYQEQHEVKQTLTEGKRAKVIQFLPGSEGACMEVKQMVVQFLLQHHPEGFRRSTKDIPGICIEIVDTGETLMIPKESLINRSLSLENTARLAMGDFNMLTKGSDYPVKLNTNRGIVNTPIQTIVVQVRHCFLLAGRSIDERIGWPMSRLHGTIPFWQDKMLNPMEQCSCTSLYEDDGFSSGTASS